MTRSPVSVSALIVCLATTVAFARPNFGRNCSDCHNGGSPPVPNALSIVGFNGMVDPDESATGATDRGLLKMFEVEPGDSVDLQVTVDFQNMADVRYAVEIKRMELSGVEAFGTLVGFTADTDWFFQIGNVFPDPNAPYYTIPVQDGIHFTAPQTFTFTMQVDAATDSDFYDLEFALAGQPGFFYTDEHFYLHVTPEPATLGLMAVGALTLVRRRRRIN